MNTVKFIENSIGANGKIFNNLGNYFTTNKDDILDLANDVLDENVNTDIKDDTVETKFLGMPKPTGIAVSITGVSILLGLVLFLTIK